MSKRHLAELTPDQTHAVLTAFGIDLKHDGSTMKAQPIARTDGLVTLRLTWRERAIGAAVTITIARLMTIEKFRELAYGG